MIFKREKQWQFLEDELIAEIKDFDDKLHTAATFLMKKGEVYTAQFLSFSESGEMRVRFATSRSVPRRAEYLYCMTLHKELRNYKNWGNRTYGDLIKDKTNQSEVICNWISPSDNPRFVIAGFRGVDPDFAEWISKAPGVVLVLGPQRPPYEYIAHLQSLTKNLLSKSLSEILDKDYLKKNWEPILLKQDKNIPKFLQEQLRFSDSIVLQGPPGTGKTTYMADLCNLLCKEGISVLVTALTNRALVELAKKDVLSDMLKKGRVYKTKVTTDEIKEVPCLQNEKSVAPKKGCIVLSTFFITSGVADECFSDGLFDYVIIDEASQALLPMLGAARMLGKKTLFVGDIKQLPPVIQLKSQRINRFNYGNLIEGLDTIIHNSSYPVYQLTESFRLTTRGTIFTGTFYNDTLVSRSKLQEYPNYDAFFLNAKGGPTLIKTDMELDCLKDCNMLNIALSVVKHIHSADKSCKIAVLSCMKETVRELQKVIYTYVKSNNIIIDTVARVQGLTTDICLYVIPNSLYMHSLELRLFNVATSRALRQTIIIADKNVLEYNRINPFVNRYLHNLNEDFSFYIPVTRNEKILDNLDNKNLE